MHILMGLLLKRCPELVELAVEGEDVEVVRDRISVTQAAPNYQELVQLDGRVCHTRYKLFLDLLA